jgi:hypothetical protein
MHISPGSSDAWRRSGSFGSDAAVVVLVVFCAFIWRVSVIVMLGE